MSGLRRLFSCIGMAVIAQGPRALVGAIPFGEAIYDVAADALKRLRSKPDAEVNAELAEAAQTDAAAARQEAEAVVAEVAADQPAEVRVNLVSYPSLVPDAVRQSLKRPADPTGKTVPPGQSLTRPEQLLPFLPARLPRFKPGDRPTPGKNWELVEMLGVGGYGEVWKAQHLQIKSIHAALKFCLDERASETLRYEGAILGRVMQYANHPGVVPLRDAHLETDPCYLQYEYIDGGNLCQLFANRPAGKALLLWSAELMRSLANTVGAFHRLNPPIVHRDLKPANILLQSEVTAAQKSVADRLRIADFGIGGLAASRSLEQEQGGKTSRGDRMLMEMSGSHTPLYASPQQARGESPDVRDDVHALGVIWYQLLTGDLSSGVGPDFKEDLKDLGADERTIALLGQCVSKKAEKRPKDAADLAAQLDALIHQPGPEIPGGGSGGKGSQEPWTDWNAALANVSNAALVAFYKKELAAGEENYLPKRHLLYRIEDKRRWCLAARRLSAYFWQEGRFEGDIDFWRSGLKQPDQVKAVKDGRCLSFSLFTEQDFQFFRQAVKEKLLAVNWTETTSGDEQGAEASSQEATVVAQVLFPVVQSREQIDENLRKIEAYLQSSEYEEWEFAHNLLRKAKCIVISNCGGRKLAGPSRFVGYVGNTLEKHTENVDKHGGETNSAISTVLGEQPANDQALEEEYQDFCRTYQVERIAQVKRTYWRMR